MADCTSRASPEQTRGIQFSKPWIFRHLDCAQFESNLGQWADQVLVSQPPTSGQAEGSAMDGKTLRGSQKQGAPGAPLALGIQPSPGHHAGTTRRRLQKQ